MEAYLGRREIETVQIIFELRDSMPQASLKTQYAKLKGLHHERKVSNLPHASVKRILDRRAVYEGRYKYAGIKATGKHPYIL